MIELRTAPYCPVLMMCADDDLRAVVGSRFAPIDAAICSMTPSFCNSPACFSWLYMAASCLLLTAVVTIRWHLSVCLSVCLFFSAWM
jgi:hypothetical protein